jgi:formylglycine-generating enzyme required for sulfatase activity
MVAIAAGEYPVGCQDGDKRPCWDDEKPGHRVALAAFAIMAHEVTVGEYEACVTAKECPRPAGKRDCTYGRPGRARYPVNCVSWEAAVAYCKFRKARLPTEGEWEAAARGPEHRDFPWGDADPTCATTVVAEGRKAGCGTGGPMPVGSMPGDRSWAGALDLGGNLREWTASPFKAYPGGHVDDPGRGMVNRGASFIMRSEDASSSHTRAVDKPGEQRPDLGLRCAADLGP